MQEYIRDVGVHQRCRSTLQIKKCFSSKQFALGLIVNSRKLFSWIFNKFIQLNQGFQRKGKIVLLHFRISFAHEKCEHFRVFFAKFRFHLFRANFVKKCEKRKSGKKRKFCEKYRIFKNKCKIQTFIKVKEEKLFI